MRKINNTNVRNYTASKYTSTIHQSQYIAVEIYHLLGGILFIYGLKYSSHASIHEFASCLSLTAKETHKIH
jgi:hypothetical protein